MKVLITGANGMVAKAAAAHCRSIGDEVLALTRAEMNIADRPSVLAAIERYQPEAILNCAAYTNVDGAESEPEIAFAANVTGVKNLAEAARIAGVAFVTISTDYVFNGRFDGFYTQDHAPDPQSVYAKTKLMGETAAIEANQDSVIVRSGWIYGSGGTNFLSVMPRLLAEGKHMKAIRDSYGTPTFAGDLAARLRELAELRKPNIYHVTNAGPGTSYLGFAEMLCDVGGFDPKLVNAVSNRDLQRPAPRPANSKLACLYSEKAGLAPMPDWIDAIRHYLAVK